MSYEVPAARRLRRGALLLALLAALSIPLPAGAADDLVGRSAYVLIGPDQSAVEMALTAGVGYLDVLLANPRLERRTRDLPELVLLPGQHILPERERRGVVINLAQLRLYVFSPEEALQVDVPIIPGSSLTKLPLGSARVSAIRYIGPPSSPDDFSRHSRIDPRPGTGHISIELRTGTTDWSIRGGGQALADPDAAMTTNLRLLDRHIDQVIRLVTPGTPVQVIDQRVAAGWYQGDIWLQVHPRVEDQALVASGLRGRAPTRGELSAVVLAAAGDLAGRVDWAAVDHVGATSNGLPVRVTRLGTSAMETP